jgi:prepilin-type N-terminal cleavage/methylation domain-containing protein
MARFRHALRRLLRQEDGFTLVEALVALTILALTSAGFAVTTGQGLRLVGTSQERQTAVQVANEWMEQARVVPFDGLALPTGTAFAGAGTPDESVTGTTFTHEGVVEELVLAADSTFSHVVSDSANNIDFDTYRYVTWVADGADTEAYKRVTVVVQWQGTSTDGEPERVSMSSLVAGDGIGWGSATPAPTVPPTTPDPTTPDPTTPPTVPPGECDGDTTGPTGSLTILAGSGSQAGYTSSSTVTVSLSATDPCLPITMAFSNDGSTWSVAEPLATDDVWTLAAGNGTRTMWVQYADGLGNTSEASRSVIVDDVKPTTPGAFTATVLNAPKRVQLTWTQSTDSQGVIGYRIYVASGAGSFQNQSTGVVHPCPSSPCTWTHSGVKNKDTYTYYVVGYDAAGNESDATAHLTRTI